MTLFCNSLHLRSRIARLSALIILSTACVLVADAQTPPYALLQQSTITGSGNTITAINVPIVTSAGVTVYTNLMIQFNVDTNGNLTVSTGFPQQTTAVSPLVTGFLAGNYVGPSTINSGKNLITVAGPGVTAGGATEWSISATSGAVIYTDPASATWYVTPIANSPIASRLQSAGITSTAWSYGVGAGYSGPYWATNTLMGFSQVGNTLTIVSFTSSGVDKNVPVDQITYTLVPAQ